MNFIIGEVLVLGAEDLLELLDLVQIGLAEFCGPQLEKEQGTLQGGLVDDDGVLAGGCLAGLLPHKC